MGAVAKQGLKRYQKHAKNINIQRLFFFPSSSSFSTFWPFSQEISALEDECKSYKHHPKTICLVVSIILFSTALPKVILTNAFSPFDSICIH
jgi:hypothetical protein